MLTLVIPVYRSEESLPDLLGVVEGMSRELQGELETVFVVDGSPDRSYEILHQALADCRFRSKLVLLSRNFGAFAAIRAGLQAGSGSRFAVMAADMQEPPRLVLEMDRALRTETCDVVIGVRAGRKDAIFSRISSGIFLGTLPPICRSRDAAGRSGCVCVQPVVSRSVIADWKSVIAH